MGQRKKGNVHYRDSESGQFVTKEYADKHPKTTEKQHLDKPNKKKKPGS